VGEADLRVPRQAADYYEPNAELSAALQLLLAS
jgi:hypothetical protein